MSYYDELVKWKDFDFENYFSNVTDEDIRESIKENRLSVYDYLNLLSPKAQNHLEEMAVKAAKLTRQHCIFLYMFLITVQAIVSIAVFQKRII